MRRPAGAAKPRPGPTVSVARPPGAVAVDKRSPAHAAADAALVRKPAAIPGRPLAPAAPAVAGRRVRALVLVRPIVLLRIAILHAELLSLFWSVFRGNGRLRGHRPRQHVAIGEDAAVVPDRPEFGLLLGTSRAAGCDCERCHEGDGHTDGKCRREWIVISWFLSQKVSAVATVNYEPVTA